MASPAEPIGILLDECKSTNDELRVRACEGAPHGSWISTRRQTAGRGRLGRHWESLEGNLFLSVLLRPQNPALLSWIPLAVAVGAARAIEQLAPGVALKLKWPNDLWVGGLKSGGILCEGAIGPDGNSVLAGIGINCARAPEGVGAIALGMSADLLRPLLIKQVLRAVDELGRSGPRVIREAYETRALFEPGTEVSWTSASGDRNGTVLRIGEAGELIARESLSGNETRIFAEDVRIRVRPEEAERSPA